MQKMGSPDYIFYIRLSMFQSESHLKKFVNAVYETKFPDEN